jgi:hypothetical protein
MFEYYKQKTKMYPYNYPHYHIHHNYNPSDMFGLPTSMCYAYICLFRLVN